MCSSLQILMAALKMSNPFTVNATGPALSNSSLLDLCQILILNYGFFFFEKQFHVAFSFLETAV